MSVMGMFGSACINRGSMGFLAYPNGIDRVFMASSPLLEEGVREGKGGSECVCEREREREREIERGRERREKRERESRSNSDRCENWSKLVRTNKQSNLAG